MCKTLKEFDTIISICRDVFVNKMHDYGLSWRVLRTSSVTDQIYIKAQRIRCLEEKKISKIDENICCEYIGIVNYAVMALIQFERDAVFASQCDMSADEAIKLYDNHVQKAKSLLEDKNHDYDEAWRNMRTSSFTDIILMRILRIKQIENLNQQTIASEGIDANYYDILNYAVFALIKLSPKS